MCKDCQEKMKDIQEYKKEGYKIVMAQTTDGHLLFANIKKGEEEIEL